MIAVARWSPETWAVHGPFAAELAGDYLIEEEVGWGARPSRRERPVRLAAVVYEALAGRRRSPVPMRARSSAQAHDPIVLARHGIALAMAGRGDEAIPAGRRAVELLPAERDALSAPSVRVHLARI